jgi:homoserine O-acetyltransferase
MSYKPEIKYYHHGRFRVSGGVIPDAFTAYCTYGDPKNPCIVFPTCYGGKLASESWKFSIFKKSIDRYPTNLLGQSYMIGDDKALDPKKYFIVTFALFSNGEVRSFTDLGG